MRRQFSANPKARPDAQTRLGQSLKHVQKERDGNGRQLTRWRSRGCVAATAAAAGSAQPH